MYEPLVFVNALKNQEATPMLASDYKWSADSKTLTFTIRDGVKWSDGKPMSAADVLFTFNLLKKYPALDINAVWSTGLQTVTSTGNQVVLTFDAPALTYFYYVAGQTPIVPEHVWTTGDPAKDPVQFQDATPIGTGPFTVNPCNPNLITYTANTSYWQPGLPHLAKVLYPAYIDNDPANLDLANDKAEWGSQFIPGVDKFYTAKDPATITRGSRRRSTSSCSSTSNTRRPASSACVRRSHTASTGQLSQPSVKVASSRPPTRAASSYRPTTTGTTSRRRQQFTFDTNKAIAALATAGYSKDNPLKLDVITIEGYTDWDASLAEIKQQLAPIGIELTINDLAQTTYNDQLYKGDFDVAYGSETGGPAPYYELRQLLYGPNTAELGENAATNYERYSDPATDALFDQFASADDATQHDIIKKLQQCDAGRDPRGTDHRVGRLVPVQHQEADGLADAGRSVRTTGCIQRAGLGRCRCPSRVEVVPGTTLHHTGIA